MEPPPAPISIISSTGMRTGRPLPLMKRSARPTSNAREVRGSPSSMRQTFAVVPPMSNDSTSAQPRERATRAARTAPPPGPDSTSRMGNASAVSRVVMPPPEVIRYSGHSNPPASRPQARSLRYPAINGFTLALATVVHSRSNSRTSGDTSLDRLTGSPGARRSTAARTARSWTGFTYECSRHTAMLSTPRPTSASTARCTLPGSSGSSTCPVAETRSETVATRSLGTRVSGFSIYRSYWS